MTSTWGQRLTRGALGGLAGGLASATMLWILVEPTLEKAIALEGAEEDIHVHGTSGSAAPVHDHGEVVTRLQQQIGGTITVLLVAVMLGIAFSVVYAKCRHRLPGNTDLGRSLSLGALAFTAMAAVPALLVPANPPGVGNPATVTTRALTYVLAILLSLLGICIVFAVQWALKARGIAPELTWISVAATAAIVFGMILFLAPSVTEDVPSTMPATIIWQFRIGSLAQLAAMWLSIGLVHGTLAQRSVARQNERRRSFETVA